MSTFEEWVSDKKRIQRGLKKDDKYQNECKEILKRALKNIDNKSLDKICNDFDPKLTQDDMNKILVEDNWEFSDKEGEEFSFNCIPFDDQLRLYVYIKDDKIFEVVLSAE